MIKRIIPTSFIRKFSTKTTQPTKETHSLYEYYLLTTLIFTTGSAALGGIDGLCLSLVEQTKQEKRLRVISVFDNTMRAVVNTVEGMLSLIHI